MKKPQKKTVEPKTKFYEYSIEHEKTNRWDWQYRNIGPGNGSMDVALSFELKSGYAYFLVVVQMDTYDSFNTTYNDRVEFVTIFKSRRKAEELSVLIENFHTRDKFKSFVDEMGKTVKINPPWIGRGNSINEVKVVRLPYFKEELPEEEI